MRTAKTLMKAVAGMAAIFLMWRVLGIQQSLAQFPTPCLPDCFNDQWSPLGSIECTLDSCGATFRIFWRSRKACNYWYDYYLERVEVVGGSVDGCLQYYGGLKELLQAITECLLKINPAGFPPDKPGDCADNWRVMRGPCWYRNGNTFEPCAYEKCCLDRYTVCRDPQNGERIVVDREVIDPGICDVTPGPRPQCEAVCD